MILIVIIAYRNKSKQVSAYIFPSRYVISLVGNLLKFSLLDDTERSYALPDLFEHV